ncbi:hypothetical protein ACLOJK_010570 [Asimina triloba]
MGMNLPKPHFQPKLIRLARLYLCIYGLCQTPNSIRTRWGSPHEQLAKKKRCDSEQSVICTGISRLMDRIIIWPGGRECAGPRWKEQRPEAAQRLGGFEHDIALALPSRLEEKQKRKPTNRNQRPPTNQPTKRIADANEGKKHS